MNQKIRAHIFVKGRVQGVFFRANTCNKAQELGITGWVRNLPNGQVEAIFEGEKQKVEEIIGWAKRGSSITRVEGIEVEFEKYKGEFNDFEIRY